VVRKPSCEKWETKKPEKCDRPRLNNWGAASCSHHEKKSKCHKKSKSSKSSGRVGTNPSCSEKRKSSHKSCKSHKKHSRSSGRVGTNPSCSRKIKSSRKSCKSQKKHSRSSGRVGTNPSSSRKHNSSCSSHHRILNRPRLGHGQRRFPLRRAPRRSPS
jgi:hypothetical protein